MTDAPADSRDSAAAGSPNSSRQSDSEPLDVLVVYVPVPDTQRVLEALFGAGAGALGDYRECAWVTEGTGQFRPVGGADPAIGTVGALEKVSENRVEVVLPRQLRRQVVTALRAAHPYEEPAFHVLEPVSTH